MSADRVVFESMYNSLATASSTGATQDAAPLVEAMDHLRHLLWREDQGWTSIFGGGTDHDDWALAVTLDDLKTWEKDLAEQTLGQAWLRRGLSLRQGYIWNGGVKYSDIPAGGSQGVKNLQKIIDSPQNQREFFGADARRRREARLYYSGIALYLGNDKTKTLEAIPLRQIDDQILDPGGSGRVWAYRRSWSERNLETGEVTPKKMWYFTHSAIGNRVKRIKEADKWVPVSQTERIFDLHASRLEGMAYGVPDALAAASWVKVVKGAYADGVSMQAALATFAYTVTSKTGRGATKASIEMASPTGAGSTAVVGENALQSISSAGKGYDFATLTSLLAIVATSLDVSVVHLSASPGDAGSSYSASETLDTPTKLAMSARRDIHAEFDRLILQWIGVPSPEVLFVPFSSGVEVYRSVQALILAATQAGIYNPQQLRNMVDDILGLPNGKVPDGTMLWNNEKALAKTAKINAASTPAPAPSSDEPNSSTASPAQGRGNGTGGQGSGAASDMRTDGVSDN